MHTTTELRVIDGLNVTITAGPALRFPPPPKSGLDTEYAPGVRISVEHPDSLRLLASEIYGAPGRSHFDPAVVNTMRRPGAYVFTWLAGEEYDAWIDARVAEVMATVRQPA